MDNINKFKTGLAARFSKHWLFNVLLAILTLHYVGGTHFRGAVFWWTASPDGNTFTIDLSFRISWRRTYRDSSFCNQTTIESKKLIGPPDAGEIFCTGGCPELLLPLGNLYYYCTDFSVYENWSSGERTYSITFPKHEYYRLGWKGKGWVEGLQQGRDAPWEFTIYVDLRVRSDTGRLNSSPRTTMTTIVALQQGCNHTLIIPREDPDGDSVFCRWAKQSHGECGGICNRYQGIQLNPSRCELSFPASANLGWYAMAIQLEDFMLEGPMVPMASVPLQFLVQLYESSSICNEMPEFIYPTPEDQSCVIASAGQLITLQITMQTKDIKTSIIEMRTTSTNGMHISSIRHKPDTSQYYVTLTWTPRQRREHIFCFNGVDSTRSSTPQRCVYFAVDPERPRAVSSYLSGDKKTILINFDQKIFLPFTRHYVWIYNRISKTLFIMVDTSVSTYVDIINKTLLINLPNEYPIYDDLYIILDEGAVRGVARCAESLSVTNPNELTLYTGTGRPPTGIITTATPPSPSGGSVVTGSQMTSPHSETGTGTIVTPSNDTGVTPAGSTDARDYTWLIVLIVIIVILIAVTGLVAVFIKKGRPMMKNKSTTPKSKPRTTIRPVMPSNPQRTNDFSDLNAKFI